MRSAQFEQIQTGVLPRHSSSEIMRLSRRKKQAGKVRRLGDSSHARFNSEKVCKASVPKPPAAMDKNFLSRAF
jgi:hypothetical protein